MASFFIVCGAVLGVTGMLAGVLTLHVVESICRSPVQIRNWDAAVRYWLIHAMVILVVAVLLLVPQGGAARGLLTAAGVLFLVGTLLYSGCLAAFAMSSRAIFAAIAPLGGLTLVIGWALLIGAGLWIG